MHIYCLKRVLFCHEILFCLFRHLSESEVRHPSQRISSLQMASGCKRTVPRRQLAPSSPFFLPSTCSLRLCRRLILNLLFAVFCFIHICFVRTVLFVTFYMQGLLIKSSVLYTRFVLSFSEDFFRHSVILIDALGCENNRPIMHNV